MVSLSNPTFVVSPPRQVYRYPGNYARYLELKEARLAAEVRLPPPYLASK